MSAKLRIAIVGPGRFGAAIGSALMQAGYKISEVVAGQSRTARQKGSKLARKLGAKSSTLASAKFSTDLVWLCVPDREIASAARALAGKTDWKGKIAFHSSGALSSKELSPLRRQGAAVASVHPLMTFVEGTLPNLVGVAFAMEGDAPALRVARSVVEALGGEPFPIRKSHKAAYHAWGGFLSPLMVAMLVTGEEVARKAGLSTAEARRKGRFLLHQTLSNYEALGPAGAFSGPLVRGDAATVRKHLKTLRQIPEALEVYRALAQSALKHLPVGDRAKMKAVLSR